MKNIEKIKKTHFYSFQCVFELPVRSKNVFLEPIWGIDVHKILPENLSRYQDKVFKKTQNTLFFSFFKFYDLHFTLSKFRPGGSILLRKLHRLSSRAKFENINFVGLPPPLKGGNPTILTKFLCSQILLSTIVDAIL